MKVNFEIQDNYAVNFQGHQIDLHNNFELQSFQYREETNEFTLVWKQSVGDWIKADNTRFIVMRHQGVTYLLVSGADPQSTEDDKVSLIDLTFYPSTDRNEHYNLTERSSPEEGDDIIYTLQSQQIIRIGCQEIKVEITGV